jgi:Domain of unknown function (DUF4260)
MSIPSLLLRGEGAALLGGALSLYFHQGFGLLLLLVLFLAPDLSMLGYLVGPRAGSLAYNAAHTTAGPIVLGVASVLAGVDLGLQLALVWLAHIGIDRLVGYGLKYPTAFKDTHLQRI